MGDLEPYMDEVFISNAFAHMGEDVISVKVIKNKQTGNRERDMRMPTGYCFVQFPMEEAAHQAMLRLNGKIIPHSMPYKRFKLNHASFGREHLSVPEYSLFVGELTPDVDDLILYSHFKKKYNSIRSAKVVMGEDGKSRGYGFVRFTSEGDQQKALVEMQHYTSMGGKPIRVSLATTKKSYSSSNSYNQNYSNNYASGYDYYQQYQQYYNGWWPGYGGYNQQQQYPSQGYPATGGYSAPPPPPTSGTPVTDGTSTAQAEEVPTESDDETPVDPELEVDVDKANAEFMERSEEFYQALEGSRWHPLDSVCCTVPATVK